MPNAIMEALAGEYEARRAQNAREEAQRFNHAVNLSPEIGRVAEARREAVFSAMRGILSSGRREDAVNHLADDMERYNRRLRELLVKTGLPEDYLQPVYQCPLCQDTGYVSTPTRARCACYNREYFKRLGHQIGLNQRTPQTFDSFREDVFSQEPVAPGMTQRAYMARLKNKCRKYADSFPDNPVPDMLFMGPSGLGKTFLMQAIAHRVLERGFSALCVSAFRVVEMGRQAYHLNDPDRSAPLYEVDMLLIDDLGAEPMMENITIQQLYQVINERQNAGKHTILSTNLSSVEFQARYTERVASRLIASRGQCELVAFVGGDLRRRMDPQEGP